MKTNLSEVESVASIDPVELGKRLRNFRILQNFTQEEVAARAGITIRTLFQIEAGKAARASSILKVCSGLGTNIDEFLRRIPQQVAQLEPVVHRDPLAEWYSPIDHRKTIPEDNASLVQDPAERLRLGKLGFTPVFVCYPRLMMPEGPGMTFLELYGRFEESFNEHIYRDALLYCQRGRARFGIAGREIEIGPGDVVGFATQDLTWGERVESSDDGPTLLVWVGAVRVGKLSPVKGARTIVRKTRASGV